MGHLQEFPGPGTQQFTAVLISPEEIVYSSNILIVCKTGEILFTWYLQD